MGNYTYKKLDAAEMQRIAKEQFTYDPIAGTIKHKLGLKPVYTKNVGFIFNLRKVPDAIQIQANHIAWFLHTGQWIDVEGGFNVTFYDDNKRNLKFENLRLSDNHMRAAHCSKKEGAYTSEYKGVSWCKQTKRWIVHCALNGKIHHVGRFDDEDEAALAYNKKATELFGEFARLNEI